MRRFIPDVFAVIGAGVVIYGVWLIYPPAALVIAGIALIFAGSRISI